MMSGGIFRFLALGVFLYFMRRDGGRGCCDQRAPGANHSFLLRTAPQAL